MTYSVAFDFGSFEGFNFRLDAAIENLLSAQQVIDWDHDEDGEAEFWPSGDNHGVAQVFSGQSTVAAWEIIALDKILAQLHGEDHECNFLHVYYATCICGFELSELTREIIEDQSLFIFGGGNLTDARRSAAYELFETFWPDAYKCWEACNCDGLIFDTDRFLDSPSWFVEGITLGDHVALLVAPR